MENLHDIFVASLRHELEDLPRGAKARIAEHLGVTSSRLADFLSGRIKTSEEIRREIADFLGYKGVEYERFMNNGRNIIRGDAPSLFKPAIKLRMVPNDDKAFEKIIARVERDTRISLGVPLDDNRNNALNAVIHEGANYDIVGYPDSRKAGVRVPINASAPVPLVKVPLFDAGAGEPSEFFLNNRTYDLSDDDDYIYVPEHEAQMGAFGVKVHGDSMAPTIDQGDIVVVMPTRAIENGRVVLACWPASDGDTAKRLVKRYKSDDRGNVVLYSDNPAHEPIILDRKADRGIQFLRVVKLVKDL